MLFITSNFSTKEERTAVRISTFCYSLNPTFLHSLHFAYKPLLIRGIGSLCLSAFYRLSIRLWLYLVIKNLIEFF